MHNIVANEDSAIRIHEIACGVQNTASDKMAIAVGFEIGPKDMEQQYRAEQR